MLKSTNWEKTKRYNFIDEETIRAMIEVAFRLGMDWGTQYGGDSVPNEINTSTEIEYVIEEMLKPFRKQHDEILCQLKKLQYE